jgi:hypothetical protein
MVLMKLGDEYKLYSHDSCIATTQESPHKRLSKQNCDDIFGVVDVEILSDEYSHDSIWFNKRGTYNNQEFFEFIAKKSFTDGFNKAMELNKDKLFTVEDVRKAMSIGLSIGYGRQFEIENKSVEIDIYIKSLQPTEIEVEIEMIKTPDGIFRENDVPYSSPKLDENGCLILKKK